MSEKGSGQELRGRWLSERALQSTHEQAPLAFDLGVQVKELRRSIGISQRELAERMGTTQSVIARLEAGGSRPSLTTLQRVGEAVGRQVEVRFRAVQRKSNRSESSLDLAQLATNLRLSAAERLARGTAFGRWVLRNRGRARAATDGRVRSG